MLAAISQSNNDRDIISFGDDIENGTGLFTSALSVDDDDIDDDDEDDIDDDVDLDDVDDLDIDEPDDITADPAIEDADLDDDLDLDDDDEDDDDDL